MDLRNNLPVVFGRTLVAGGFEAEPDSQAGVNVQPAEADSAVVPGLNDGPHWRLHC
jgi:hypothetical protein